MPCDSDLVFASSFSRQNRGRHLVFRFFGFPDPLLPPSYSHTPVLFALGFFVLQTMLVYSLSFKSVFFLLFSFCFSYFRSVCSQKIENSVRRAIFRYFRFVSSYFRSVSFLQIENSVRAHKIPYFRPWTMLYL